MIGWRAWFVEERDRCTLRSIAQRGHVWPVGPATADCKIDKHRGDGAPHHVIPSSACNCGWYAVHDIRGIWRNYPTYPKLGSYAAGAGFMVAGAVLMWGEMIVHERVVRSEHAQVLAILDCEIDGTMKTSRADLLTPIAAHYGVPVKSIDTIELYCSEFGEPAAEWPDDDVVDGQLRRMMAHQPISSGWTGSTAISVNTNTTVALAAGAAASVMFTPLPSVASPPPASESEQAKAAARIYVDQLIRGAMHASPAPQHWSPLMNAIGAWLPGDALPVKDQRDLLRRMLGG